MGVAGLDGTMGGVAVCSPQGLMKTEMSLVFSLAVKISRRPSWLKSPGSADTGLDPAGPGEGNAGWEVPLRLPRKIETLSQECPGETGWRMPSQLKPPAEANVGFNPPLG